MILYFADRKMNILGQASTSLPEGVIISNDRKTEEVDEGVAILEFDLEYDPEWRKKAETWTEAGNYILRKDGDDREFYTIISREKDPVNGSVNDIYAEDAGLDLLNEVVGAYKADKAYSAEFYIKKFSYDSGFEVGVNEVSNLTRKLSWDGEATATERLLSIATQFDNAEISFSFDVDRMSVVHKYINIFKRRGVNSGVQLQIGREIKKIRIKDTIEDLATAYVCTGGIPDGKDDPITLAGYKYDDGDFYVEGTHLNSRKALQKWSRYQIKTETGDNVGHIVKTFSYDTTSQSELCNRAVSSLKKICDVNTTYEVELSYLPQGTKIGDTVYIIDHTGELYLSSRLLKIETSVCDNTKTAELGKYSVKSSGVSEELRELADAFAKVAQNRKFYTWIAYADDDIGTGASLDSYGKEYLGIASNRVTRDPDLTDPTVYTWVRIRGEQGIPGTSGKDGKTSYFHVKYSDVEKPASYSDMTETPSKYIGTYVDYELEDSKDPSKYTWSKFQGEDGADGVAGKNGENGEASYVHFAYATSEDGKANFSTTDPTDKTYIGQYVDFKKVDSEQPEKYRWSKFQGPKGPAGSDGEQGYGIVASVTRENFTEDQWNSTYGMTGHLASWTGTSTLRNGCRIGDIFVVVGTAADTKNAHTAYYRSDTDAGDLQGICIGHTIAFRGSAGIDGTDGKGIESIKEHYAVSTSNTVTPTVWFDDVLVTNSVNKYLWSYETIIYTDGTSVDSNKRVIGTYGDTGKDGATGADGKGIKSTVITYQASTSGTVIPTGTWQTSIPTVSAGQYLWTRTVITYTDDSKSTSYSVGRMGTNGTNGSAGRGIKSTAITYQAGSSGTTAPTGTWQTTVPATSASSPYLWTRTIITYTDDTTSTSYAVGSTLEGVSVGGRNLARKTSNEYCTAFNSFNGSDNICPNLAMVSTAGLTVGDKVTVRLVYKYTNIVAVTGKTAAAWLQGAGNITEWKSGTFVSNQCIALSGSGEKVIKYSFTITSDMIKNQCWYVNIRHDGVKSGSVQWKEFKVEKGNIATDWTPAPEDGIASVDVEYYLSNSATALSGGSWSTTAPTWVNGKYMWSRTVTTDGAGNKTYSPNQNGVCIAGAKGETGNDGKNALQPKRNWSGTFTTIGETANVSTSSFNRTPVVGDVFTNLDGSSNTGTWEITKIENGNAFFKLLSYVSSKGATGATGATGKGVSSIVEQYYKSTSATALSGGSWSTTYPGWESGKYIWTRSVITYTDGNAITTNPICVSGDKGETGNTALAFKKNFTGTYTTVGDGSNAMLTSFNRTPVVGDIFTNIDGSSNTGTWEITKIENDRAYFKLLSYVNSKGEKGEKGNTGATGPKGDGLDVKDTRATNESPNWYIKNYPKTTVMEFKECKAIGLSNVGTYCNLQTIVIWSDSSGGYPRQTAKIEGTGKEYWRVGTSNTTWSSWIDPYGKSLEAAKTATNFMEFTSGTGLQIGDKTNGTWKGFRSRITSTAFEILNEAGAAVASYGRKLIQLGKDSVDAIIELCGGKGNIKYATPENNYIQQGLALDRGLVIESVDNIIIKPANKFFVNTELTDSTTDFVGRSSITPGSFQLNVWQSNKGSNIINASVGIEGNIEEGLNLEATGGKYDFLEAIRFNNISLLDWIYPVGSIYMSAKEGNPALLFGGTWVAWGAGRVPVGFNGSDGNFNSSEKTGGSKTINIQHNHGLSNARAAVGRADSSLSTMSYTSGGNPHNVYFDREFSYYGGISGGSKHATDTSLIYGNTNNGGSTAASVLQPYIVCYMWKRTA